MSGLVGGVLAQQLRRDDLDHVVDGLPDALAAVAALVAVAQLHGLVGTGGGAGGHGGSPDRTRVGDHHDLDGRVAA